jgi:hypothetical protein
MWVKQMSVEDWHKMFEEHAITLSQVDIIKRRIEDQPGYKLATWERNALRAYEKLTKNS